MGQAKRQLEDFDNQGFDSVPGKFVCEDHFEEEVLKSLIRRSAQYMSCTYCGTQSLAAIAVPVDFVLGVIVEAIRYAYEPAEGALPYDSSEGGYQYDAVCDTYDILTEEFALGIEPRELAGDLLNAIHGGDWCPRDPFRLPEDRRLMYSWELFQEVTKHSRRYFFAGHQSPSPSINADERLSGPATLLAEIATAINVLDLYRSVDASVPIYRARYGTAPFLNAKELGAAPEAITSPNRMSPAGISMFYGAWDSATALEEAKSVDNATEVTVGLFRAHRRLVIVDLARLPRGPSPFDIQRRRFRHTISFLRDFAKEISRPISPLAAAVDYVPTQVLTEFFRHELRSSTYEHIDGLVYMSAVCPGRECLVLFARNSECCDPADIGAETTLVLCEAHVQHVSGNSAVG